MKPSTRTTSFVDLNKKRLVLNAFFMSQFSYWHLVWVPVNRTKHNINRLHGKCLCCGGKMSSFKKLIEIDSSASIHNRNPKDLAIDMCKVYHDISLSIMKKISTLRDQNQYNLRNWSE